MAESSHDGPDRELVPVRRFEWERLVRRVKMSRSTKALAFILATYASADGSRVRPGRERLANVADRSPRSVSRALVELRDMGLIQRVTSGSNYGRQAVSDEYRLTIPTDLIDRAEMLDPDEGTSDTTGTRSQPEQVTPLAPDRNGTGDTTRQEQVTKLTEQVTPVTGTGDTSVHLPEQDQPSTPEQDQASVTHTVTEGDADPWPADDGLDWSKKDHECHDGYLGVDDEGRPRPCLECRPHLARVIPMFEKETA